MILISLGANLPGPFGPPEAALEEAKRALGARGVEVVKSSRTWLTEPLPVSDQPWFRNAVIAVKTDLSAPRLLVVLSDVEREFGRVSQERNAPRTLDLDLIAYNDEVWSGPDLVLPHPRMHGRAFVLMPLQEIAPEWLHPVFNRTIDELIENMPAGQRLEAIGAT